MEKIIRLADIPLDTLSDIGETLRFYTVAFTHVVEERQQPQLLGSGVLVSARGVRAILTADHVAEVLPREGRIGVFMNPGGRFESIDATGVHAFRIARGDSDATGPDLGVVVLAPPIASSIGARKSFYNLDTRRDSILQSPPDVHAGPWFAQGYLEEKSVIERSPGVVDFYASALSQVGSHPVGSGGE